MRRILLRLSMLALVGAGLWVLYERFGGRVRRLSRTARGFAGRATDAAREAEHAFAESGSRAVDAAGRAAEQITDAASTATDKISDAAADAGQQAAADLG